MERKGQGIFYGVIGVATLIVAIIGATFAYFTATASNSTTIAGNAASVGLTLSVEKVSHGDKGLVPQLETALSAAMKGKDGAGTGSDSCIDGNGNTVCQVYKITVGNTGTGWGSEPAAQGAKADNKLVENVTISGSGSQEYYVVIWIQETNDAQEDTGGFSGTVAFNAADGSGVTSTFTA